MKREIRFTPSAGIGLREIGGKELIRGYAAVFNQLSENLGGFREQIRHGAFRSSLSQGRDVRALIDHDSSKIIGRSKSGTLTMREDPHGLYVEIDPPDTTVGRDVVESLRRGDLDQMSFAFRCLTDDWSKRDGENIREVRDLELHDVSVVTFPAYPQTSVSVRSVYWPDGVPEEITARVADPYTGMSLAELNQEHAKLRLQHRINTLKYRRDHV